MPDRGGNHQSQDERSRPIQARFDEARPDRESRAETRAVAEICESDFSLTAALAQAPVAIALITGVEGPSYRPRGAAMVVTAQGHRTGGLSAGCLERDVILHAQAALADGGARRLRYGRGSPFMDITLPCGGALDIAVVPRPDPALLARIGARLAARQAATLVLSPEGSLCADGPGLTIRIRPQLRFVVMGKGPEASCFATLARQAGYPVDLRSPDGETLRAAGFGEELVTAHWPEGLGLDPYTAVTLFFHDHDREPPLLAAALQGPAFYVGAQGSLRAHLARREALEQRGLDRTQIDRMASPFGLIPSARDPRTLAISVLAQVLDRAKATFTGASP